MRKGPETTVYEEFSHVCNLTLSSRQLEQVGLYIGLLRKWQGRINVTAITDQEQLLRFHFFEAFWTASHFLVGRERVIDIGSGAGFPGLAMKLFMPSLEMTLIEKSLKKCVFLDTVGRILGLKIRTFNGPVEAFPEFSGVHVASVRALKPSSEALRLLSQHGILLLLLHGSSVEEIGEGWTLEKRKKYPFSENRYASLYRPMHCST